MLSYIFPFSFLSLLGYFILVPVVSYFRDPKGFRKFPAINAIAGFSDLGFMWEASKGFRSKTLNELHRTHDIVRIGPNSLSYGHVAAIKVIRLCN
jgi:hypothetical protein